MSFAIFDEKYYLSNNTDVVNAVRAGVFKSGFEHFQQYGLKEGRVKVSSFYDEQLYLKKNPDVKKAIDAGVFKSGLEHYIQYGEAEGRSPGAFDEEAYLQQNPDVKQAVKNGTFKSGLQHYIQYGRGDRIGSFFGTDGNDVIASADGLVNIVVGIPYSVVNGSLTAGTGENDTLLGGVGTDVFFLGISSQKYYVGSGNTDYALINNFQSINNIGSLVLPDYISLPGSPSDYKFETVNGSFNISTASGDLIGIVEGVESLEPISSLPALPLVSSSGSFWLS